MSTDVEIIPLARVDIRTEPDIVVSRQQARHFAAALGFDAQSSYRAIFNLVVGIRSVSFYAAENQAGNLHFADCSGAGDTFR